MADEIKEYLEKHWSASCKNFESLATNEDYCKKCGWHKEAGRHMDTSQEPMQEQLERILKIEKETTLMKQQMNQNATLMSPSQVWAQICANSQPVDPDRFPKNSLAWVPSVSNHQAPKWLSTVSEIVNTWKKNHGKEPQTDNHLLHPLFRALMNQEENVPAFTKEIPEKKSKKSKQQSKPIPPCRQLPGTHLTLHHTSSAAYLGGLSPDFTLTRNGRPVAEITAVGFIEICSTMDSGHKAKVVNYNKQALKAQRPRSSIVSALTDLRTVQFFYNTEDDVKNQFSIEFDMLGEGFARLYSLVCESSSEQLGWNIPTFSLKQTTLEPLSVLGLGRWGVVYKVTVDEKEYAMKHYDLSKPAAIASMQNEISWLETFKDIFPLQLVGKYQSDKKEDALLLTPIGSVMNEDLSWPQLALMGDIIKKLIQAGCVHRDLSSRHFLIERVSDKIFLIDYGFAVKHGTKDTFAGSSHFAANEVLEKVVVNNACEITWLISHNLESFVKVIYARFFPGFRGTLFGLAGSDNNGILELWRNEEKNMGLVWTMLLSRARGSLENKHDIVPVDDKKPSAEPSSQKRTKKERQKGKRMSDLQKINALKDSSTVLPKDCEACCAVVDYIINWLGLIVAGHTSSLDKSNPKKAIIREMDNMLALGPRASSAAGGPQMMESCAKKL